MKFTLIRELIRSLSDRYTDDELEYFVTYGFIDEEEYNDILWMRRQPVLLRRLEMLKEQIRILQECHQRAFMFAVSWSCKINSVCEEQKHPRWRAPPPGGKLDTRNSVRLFSSIAFLVILVILFIFTRGSSEKRFYD